MAAAIALAIVLVVAVGGISLAMQTQRPLQNPSARPRPQPRTSPMAGRIRTRRPGPTVVPDEPSIPDPPKSPAASVPDPAAKGPELLRTGVPAQAKVINVVDERVVGSVTRSRLTLKIQPEEGDEFEVVLRHAFATTEARAKVKVGGTVPVRYDKDRPKKVVIDPNED